MHRKLEAELLHLDTEIKITLKNLRRITSAESRNMENQTPTEDDFSEDEWLNLLPP